MPGKHNAGCRCCGTSCQFCTGTPSAEVTVTFSGITKRSGTITCDCTLAQCTNYNRSFVLPFIGAMQAPIFGGAACVWGDEFVLDTDYYCDDAGVVYVYVYLQGVNLVVLLIYDCGTTCLISGSVDLGESPACTDVATTIPLNGTTGSLCACYPGAGAEAVVSL